VIAGLSFAGSLFYERLLQVFYTVRSERLLMEELNYNLLFRWLWD
jgi:transposase